MGKRLDITPQIAAAIARSTDGSVDPSDVAVFETISLNTLPISKKGTLFSGAVAAESLLMQMAEYVNAPGGFVPLHNNHDQGQELPVGRVFAGEARQTSEGITELRTQFYLPLSEAALVSKVETGVVEEVSVGLQPTHMNCSECGFDYNGPEATLDNFWTQTCANDHTIGKDGVHVNMVGLSRFWEQSLVSVGAAHKAKIQPRAKALMGDQYAQQLAATGVPPEAKILFASPTKKEPAMELTALVAELTTAKAGVLVSEAALTAANATLATLNETITALNAEIVTLKATADVKVPEVQAQLEAANTALTDATAVMRVEADRLTVAAGLTKPADDASIAALTEAITSARTKLASSIPVGGLSLSTEAGSGKKQTTTAASSFKTR